MGVRLKTKVAFIASFLLTGVLIVSACGGGGGEPTAAPTATRVPVAPTPTPQPTVAATPTPSGPQPKIGGILKTRQITEWASWDTWANAGGPSCYLSCYVWSNLFHHDLDDHTKLTPDLAKSWQVSSNGLTYTISIRNDVSWHDGKPLTGEDVLWNLKRGWQPPEPTVSFNVRKFLSVESMSLSDPYTVVINLKRPSASFLPGLGVRYILIYPPHIPSSAWRDNPVGTGPFRYRSWTRDASFEGRRNTSYYKRDAAGRQLPYLDGIDTFVIRDSTQALAAFRTGRIDCGCGADHDFATINADLLKREIPGVHQWLVLADQFNLVFNWEKPPFTDQRVREAFSALLDRQAIVALPRGGYGRFPPGYMKQPELGGQWGLPEAELKTFPGFRDRSIDVSHAQRLLREAGVDLTQLRLTFVAVDSGPVTPYHEAAHVLLVQGTGANIVYRKEPSVQYTQALAIKNFDITMTSGGTNYDDPDDYFLDAVTTNGARNPPKFNYGVDDLASLQGETLDFAKRREIVYTIQRKLIKDAIFIPTVYQVNGFVTHPYVRGYVPPPFSGGAHFRLERVWLDR